MRYETLTGFASLFAGRTDAYFDSIRTQAVWKPLTLNHFARHINGAIEIGTYPVLDNALCRWGCIDIDIKDDDSQAWNLALDVADVWSHYKVSAYIERSRSKGYHIWTFADTWIPATYMQLAGKYISRIAKLDPKTEVNPKNDAPWKLRNGLVNTVRTPYSGRANPGRMVMVDRQGEPLPIDGFVSLARATRTPLRRFRGLAGTELAIRERESRTEAPRGVSGPPRSGGSLSGRAAQEAQQVLAGKRFVVSGERDNQLFTVACVLKAKGVNKQDAYRIMESVYHNQVRDKTDYSLNEALRKIDSAYR